MPFLTWQAWALLSAVLTALTAVLARAASTGEGSDAAVFVRSIVILVVLALVCAATGQWPAIKGMTGRHLGFLGLSGVATAGSWVCYFRALRVGQAAQVATLNKLSIVLVAVLGTVFLGERLTPVNWLGLGFVAAGAYLISYRG